MQYIYVCKLWGCRKETPLVQAIIVDLQGVDQETTKKIGQFVRIETGYEAVPIIALTFLPTHEELKEAGYSSSMLKPLRHSTVATILLQAFGVRTNMPTKKANSNPKLLAGKRLLVVHLQHILFVFYLFFLG